jgi:hypothetical protein
VAPCRLVDTNLLNKHTTSIFRAEETDSLYWVRRTRLGRLTNMMSRNEQEMVWANRESARMEQTGGLSLNRQKRKEQLSW